MDVIPASQKLGFQTGWRAIHFFLYPNSLTTDSLPLCHGANEKCDR